MTTEDDFHKALDANPDDHQTRLVFADFLQEHGDPRAEGYRALGTLGKRPNNSGNGDVFYENANYRRYGGIEPRYLPEDWFNLVNLEELEGMKPRWSTTPKEHRTRRHLEDAAALAFSQLPHARREELLGQSAQPSAEQSAEKLTRRRMARRKYRG